MIRRIIECETACCNAYEEIDDDVILPKDWTLQDKKHFCPECSEKRKEEEKKQKRDAIRYVMAGVETPEYEAVIASQLRAGPDYKALFQVSRSENTWIRSEMSRSKKDLAASRFEAKRHIDEAVRLNIELGEKRTRIAELTAENERLSEEIKQLKDEINMPMADNAALGEIIGLKQFLKQRDIYIDDMQKTLDNGRAKYNQLRDEAEKLKADLSKSRANEDRWWSEAMECGKKNEALKAENERLRGEIEEFRKNVPAQFSGRLYFKDFVEKTSMDLENKKWREIEYLKADIAAERATIKQLKAEHKAMQKRIGRQRKELSNRVKISRDPPPMKPEPGDKLYTRDGYCAGEIVGIECRVDGAFDICFRCDARAITEEE